jgi:enoyl-CoA hydratase/carnithine racemase
VLKQVYYPVLRRLAFVHSDRRRGQRPAMGFGLSPALMVDLAGRSQLFFQLTFAHRSRSRWRRAVAASAHDRHGAPRSWSLAERLSAEKAFEWGLINQVHDDDKLQAAPSRWYRSDCPASR